MKLLTQTGRLALLLLCIAGVGAVARADVKIKTRSNSGGQTTESVTYIKGKRQRAEYGTAVTITQCDLRRTLQLAVPSKTYTVTPFGGGGVAGVATTNAAGQPSTPRRGGVVTTTINATDTGERKTFFGLTARRIKTKMVTESSPDACSPVKSRMETDGWYIDAAFALDCENGGFAGYVPPASADGCRDEYRTKQVGTARTGYPVLLTTTIFDESGTPSFSWTQEVVELSKAVLDAALFEAPGDFRQVSSQQELYGAAGAVSAPAAGDDEEADKGENAASNGGDIVTHLARQAATAVFVELNKK